MGKVAFVFSGQGDQFPGMGKSLMDIPAGKAMFDLCDSIRPGTSKQCFEGTAEELKETANTQPCLYALELSLAGALREKGLVPDAAAGFSLGEISAAAWAGLYTAETGFRLVMERGKLMQAAAQEQDTAMAAVLKLTKEQVEDLCAKHENLYPVNFNCPGQISVSGLKQEMDAFLPEVKAAGGRAIPLKVKGAFHSPFMKKASEGFAGVLKTADMQQPFIPLYSDLTADVYGENPRKLLAEQICSPVEWEKLIRNLIASGVDTFVEIGPGRTLTNLIKKIDPAVTTVTGMEKLEELYADR